LTNIERLIVSKSLGTPLEDLSTRWLASLDGKLLDRLAKAGLARGRQCTDLRTFISAYIESRNDVKPASKTVWRQGESSVYEFFGKERLAHTISHAEAEDFRQFLLKQPLAAYTVRKRLQAAKMFFSAMVKRGLIPSSPFEGIATVAAVVDETRNVYVPAKDVELVMDEAPDAEWRAMIALSRFGGLRLPSEVLSLKWEDVHWGRAKITVTSPKTAHHVGGGQRTIPLFPELEQPLREAFDAASEGAVYVVTRHRSRGESDEGFKNSNYRTTFNKMVKRAGLQAWPKPFHAMRASRETDLLETHPLQAVTRWFGHSPKVAVANYLRVREEHYDRAVNRRPTNPAHIPAHSSHVRANQSDSALSESLKNTGSEEACLTATIQATDGEGFEPPVESTLLRFSRPVH